MAAADAGMSMRPFAAADSVRRSMRRRSKDRRPWISRCGVGRLRWAEFGRGWRKRKEAGGIPADSTRSTPARHGRAAADQCGPAINQGFGPLSTALPAGVVPCAPV